MLTRTAYSKRRPNRYPEKQEWDLKQEVEPNILFEEVKAVILKLGPRRDNKWAYKNERRQIKWSIDNFEQVQNPRRLVSVTQTKLTKKEDRQEMANYHQISLGSTRAKISSNVILNWLKPPLVEQQPTERANFWRLFLLTDHFHAISQIMEKERKYQLIYHQHGLSHTLKI